MIDMIGLGEYNRKDDKNSKSNNWLHKYI